MPDVALGEGEDKRIAIGVVADLADELDGGPALRRRQCDARGRARRHGVVFDARKHRLADHDDHRPSLPRVVRARPRVVRARPRVAA